uniref:Protein SCAI-like n=1 Tax=Nicotiana sylvestris TaxID=4096 RepID=A0A1U7X4P7_NICSY|nr:PREDICTED: protein SCAI-like [Nicotiana sylvestris]
MLLSPTISLPISAMDSRQPSGSSFTGFITVPLQAFILMLGFTASDIDVDMYDEKGLLLAASDNLNPVWSQTLGDPFLRRLILRFIFCRAALALYAPTFNKIEFLPECIPCLPDAVLPTSAACQRTMLQLADIFGATSKFNFSKETVLSDDRSQEN